MTTVGGKSGGKLWLPSAAVASTLPPSSRTPTSTGGQGRSSRADQPEFVSYPSRTAASLEQPGQRTPSGLLAHDGEALGVVQQAAEVDKSAAAMAMGAPRLSRSATPALALAPDASSLAPRLCSHHPGSRQEPCITRKEQIL